MFNQDRSLIEKFYKQLVIILGHEAIAARSLYPYLHNCQLILS